MTLPAPVPEIPAANIDKAAAYYVNTLGFTFDWGDEQGGIAGCLLPIARRRDFNRQALPWKHCP